MTLRHGFEEDVESHRDRPTQAAKIGSTIRRPSEPPGQLVPDLPAGRREGVGAVAPRRRRPRPPAGRASPSGRPPRSARASLSRGSGLAAKRSCWVPERPLVPGDAVEPGPARVGDVDRRRPAPGRPACLVERDGRQRLAARRRPGGVSRTLASCWLEWTTRRGRSPAVTVLVKRRRPRRPADGLADRQDEARLDRPVVAGAVGGGRPEQDPALADDPLDHRGRPRRVVPAGRAPGPAPRLAGRLVHGHELADRAPAPAPRASAPAASRSATAGPARRSGPGSLSSTSAFSGNGRSRLARSVEQVVVEADVELRPGEDHQAHPAADELGQLASACSGVGAATLARTRTSAGSSRGERKSSSWTTSTRQASASPTPIDSGRGEVIDLRPERLRRGLAVDQADQERVLDRDRRPVLVVARQLVLGELEREVVRPLRREPDGQRHPRRLSGRDLGQGHLGRPVVHPEDRLGPG